ncbi:MDR family MFS transporter [Chloroflexota bacterium]
MQGSSEAGNNAVSLYALPKRQVIITMAGVMLAMFLSSLDQTVVATAMPRIIADLHGFTQYTWVTTAYIISSAVAIPITGKLTDMYGRKNFYIAGLIIFTGASLLCGISSSMPQMIIGRSIQGIGAGIIMANTFTVIGDLFPPVERGKYQGLISGVWGVSSIIGPTLGGFLTDTLSWHWVFFINIPLGILITILFILYFPNFKPANLKHQVDYFGLVTFVLSVVPLMLALSWGGVTYQWLSTPIISLLILSTVSGISFVIIETRSAEPIIPLSLFQNQIVALSMLIIFFTAFGMFGSIIFVPLFFQGVLGVTATESGSLLIPMMLGMVAGSFSSGQALSRAGGHYRLQGIVGIAVMALGMLFLSRMTVETSTSVAVFNTILMGFGLGITMPLYTIAVQNAVSYKILGVATSATAFIRSIGGSVGLAIFGSVMSNRFGIKFMGNISSEVKEIIPQERLEFIARNPQALVSPEAQVQLKTMFEQIAPGSSQLLHQVLQALKGALEFALSEVFIIGFIAVLIAFIINLFLREIPLHKQHFITEPPGAKPEIKLKDGNL